MDNNQSVSTTTQTDEPTAAHDLKRLFAGYNFVLARHHYNKWQMRLLYRIVEFAQAYINQDFFTDYQRTYTENLRDVTLKIPLADVMDDNSHHHTDVRRHIVSMQQHIIELVDQDSRRYYSSSLISNVVYEQGTGLLIFSVAKFIWQHILDFSRGFRAVELNVIMQLKSANSIRLYQLISGQSTPISYRLDWLRTYFGCQDKYQQANDFFKRVLDPSIKELDLVAPWSTKYAPVKLGKRYVQVNFWPYFIEGNANLQKQKKSLLSQISLSSLVTNEVYRYLRYNMGFSTSELKPHKQLLSDLMAKHPDVVAVLADIQRRRRGKDGTYKGKGWVIQALRGVLDSQSSVRQV